MRSLILALTLLSVAFAVPLTKGKLEDVLLAHNFQGDDKALRDPMLEAFILGLIEDFRDIMVTGSDVIPVLDPLEVDHLAVDDEIIPFPGAHAEVNNLIIKQLSTFVIDDLSVRTVSASLLQYGIQVDGYIPELDVDVENYDMYINALGFEVFGNGRANLKFIRPRVKADMVASLSISISTGISFDLIDCKIQFSLVGFEPEITGLFNNDAASSFASAVLRHLVPDLILFYENEINDFLSALVLELVSDLLS